MWFNSSCYWTWYNFSQSFTIIYIKRLMRRYVKQHFWHSSIICYLSQEMLPLCLFSDHMPYDQKSCGKGNIELSKIRDGHQKIWYRVWKTWFPDVNIADVSSKDLKHFVGLDSWKCVGHVGIDSSFLSEPANSWENIAVYLDVALEFWTLQFENDAAERDV